jgi:hypothetical protein
LSFPSLPLVNFQGTATKKREPKKTLREVGAKVARSSLVRLCRKHSQTEERKRWQRRKPYPFPRWTSESEESKKWHHSSRPWENWTKREGWMIKRKGEL